MFSLARLKLTGWYLVIIFFISGLFSMAFYQVSTREIRKILTRVQVMERRWQEGFSEFPQLASPPGAPSIEELETSTQRLFINLIFINGIILVVAGGSAYFLAGKTLTPIKTMVEEQNQFITNSSHELRTPIATLRAEMEGSLLEKNISDKQARSLIQSNIEELSKLQKLSDKLLEIAKIHDISPKKMIASTRTSELITSAMEQTKKLAKNNTITIELHNKDFSVQGDKENLVGVFVILIENAIKYSKKNSKLHISVKKKNRMINISVKDHGIGIASEEIPYIFDRFYRSDTSRSQTEGFGLGLSIAKQIVEKHGGSINVISSLGKGSTFTVSLPIA